MSIPADPTITPTDPTVTPAPAPVTTFSMDIPADQVGRVLAAFCATHGYQPLMPDGTPNPVTPGQFTKGIVGAWIVRVVANYEAQQAQQTTFDAVTGSLVLG